MEARLRAFVRENADCFRRSHLPGHVTGSAWIVDRSRTQTLLTYHGKLGRWLQLGGHWEEGEEILETALREAREECGLLRIEPISEAIFDLDIHLIPAGKGVPDHLHYDVRFAFEANREDELIASPESRQLAWVALDRVRELNPDPCVARMVAKSATLGRL